MNQPRREASSDSATTMTIQSLHQIAPTDTHNIPKMLIPHYHAHIMAVDRVEQRLRRVTAALDAAGVGYAVIGGNAVAAWVGRVDPSATRATKDVDILVERETASRLTEVMRGLGYLQEEIIGVRVFIDPDEPSVRSGIHVVWADEIVRPEYSIPAPSIHEAEIDPQGFRVVNVPALVRMKLTSFRPIDQAHVQDLMSVGLIDNAVRSSLPPALRERLRQVEST